MKKSLLLILSFFSGVLYADTQTQTLSNGVILEFRPSYFYPISSDFREIFQDGGINYQLTSMCSIYKGENIWLRGLDIWAGVDYFAKEGHSKGLNDKTNIRIVLDFDLRVD